MSRKILVLSANPKGTGALQIQDELKHIKDRIERSGQAGEFDVQIETSVALADLQQFMLRHKPAIVHFSGHGKAEGLLFNTPDGERQLAHPQGIAAVFRRFKEFVECVVLNACYSETQARAIFQHIPCVVGMQTRVPDQAALYFADGFYTGLAHGCSYRDAFESGVAQIQVYPKYSEHCHIPKFLETPPPSEDEDTRPHASELLAYPEFIQTLAAHLRQKRLAVCIGGEFARNAGVPGWKHIFKQLGCQADELMIAESDYAELADTLVEQGRFSLTELKARIQHEIDETAPVPGAPCKLLAQLPVDPLLTTNYDLTLEDLYPRSRMRRVGGEEQAGNFNLDGNKILLVYLLGNVEDPERMAVTQGETYAYPDTHPQLLAALHDLLRERPVLFLGYRANDPVLDALLDHFRAGIRAASHYAVFSTTEETALIRYRLRHGLTVLAVDGISGIQRLLEDLLALHQGRSVNETPQESEELISEIKERLARPAPGPFSDLSFVPPVYLPNPVPHFTGREADFAAVLEALDKDSPVSITGLMGMGGIGKTSLALAVAHHCRDHNLFPDGICWHTLADKDLDTSLEELADAFAMRWMADVDGTERRKRAFQQALHKREALFILDDANYAARVPAMLDLLVGHPVLITSRANLSGLTRSITVERLNRKNARRLFIKTRDELDDSRADAAIAALDETELAALENVCEELLGGLPLALSIAASLAARRVWSLPTLAQRLEAKSLDLLQDPQRVNSMFRKDRDVRLSFALSYDLLPEQGRLVFDVTGVFSTDPFSIEALAETAGLGMDEAEQMAEILVGLSLLQRADERRVRLHPLTREYAVEKLGERDQQAPWERMVQHYVKQVKDNPKALAYDWRNALNAVNWCFEHQRFEDGLFLMEKVDRFLYETGLWSIREGWLRSAIKVSEAFESPERTFWFKERQADQWTRQAHDLKALEAYQDLRGLCERFPELRNRVGWCDYMLAFLHGRLYQRQQALMLDQANLRPQLRERDWAYLGAVLSNLGGYFRHFAAVNQAQACYGTNLAIKTGAKSEENIPRAHADIFDCRYIQGDYPAAAQSLQAMREALDAHPNLETEGDFQEIRFFLALSQQDYATAAQALLLYQDIAIQLGMLKGIAYAQYYQGYLNQLQGRSQTAEIALQRALELHRGYGYEADQGDCHRRLGLLYTRKGELRTARNHLEQAKTLAEKYSGPVDLARWEAVYALLQAHSGYSFDAVRGIRRALNTFAALGIGNIEEEQAIRGEIERELGEDYARAMEQLQAEGLADEILDLMRDAVDLDPETKIIVSPADQREMVLVPSGMVESEHYEYPFFLYPFYMDRYPVSNRDYQAFLDAMDLPAPSCWPNGQIPPGREDHPVTGISLDEAQGYAEWCGKTLPLAEEWETAAGIRQGREYPPGGEWDQERERQWTELLHAKGFRRLEFTTFKGRRKRVLWTDLRFPAHRLKLDEEGFLRWLIGSISLMLDEKQRIIEALPRLTQQQADELLRILKEEREKFAAMEEQHDAQLDALEDKYWEDWLNLERQRRLSDLAEQEFLALPAAPEEKIAFFSTRIQEWTHSPQNPGQSDTAYWVKGDSWLTLDADTCRLAHKAPVNPYQRPLSVGFRCVKPVFAKADVQAFLHAGGVDARTPAELSEWWVRRAEHLFAKPNRGEEDAKQGMEYCRKALRLRARHHKAAELLIRFQYAAHKSLKTRTAELQTDSLVNFPSSQIQALFQQLQEQEEAAQGRLEDLTATWTTLREILFALEQTSGLPDLCLTDRNQTRKQDYIINLYREKFPFDSFVLILLAFTVKWRWFSIVQSKHKPVLEIARPDTAPDSAPENSLIIRNSGFLGLSSLRLDFRIRIPGNAQPVAHSVHITALAPEEIRVVEAEGAPITAVLPPQQPQSQSVMPNTPAPPPPSVGDYTVSYQLAEFSVTFEGVNLFSQGAIALSNIGHDQPAQADPGEVIKEALYPLGDDFPDFAAMPEEQARQTLQGLGFRAMELDYFSGRKRVVLWTAIRLPAHQLEIEEEMFLGLLIRSASLKKDEKGRIVKAIPRLTQPQIDELMRLFTEEGEKFAILPPDQYAQMDAMNEKYFNEWRELERDKISHDQPAQLVQAADPGKVVEEVLYPLGDDFPDFAAMPEEQARQTLQGLGFRAMELDYFSGRKRVVLWTAIHLPAHQLEIEEEMFLGLLIRSVSLKKDEKGRIVEAIPRLTQEHIDEVMRILTEEGKEFAILPPEQHAQMDVLNEKHFNEWRELERDKISHSLADSSRESEETLLPLPSQGGEVSLADIISHAQSSQLVQAADPGEVVEEILYPLGDDLPDFAAMPEEQARQTLEGLGFRAMELDYFSRRKRVVLWTAIRLPAHQLEIEEEVFLGLLIRSVSLMKDEKGRIVEAISRLTQEQIDELMRVLTEEGDKFATMEPQHHAQMDALNEKHFDEWRELERENRFAIGS
ncbi:MAG: SUMF1/EgtB/PvdO family nonheme iron enzyme [Gammaproteobacteria bacterium]|nr:SUMF1/EgtB/PvdO family nonheme iron enzyme [Gammaproteobacteria bacterium]